MKKWKLTLGILTAAFALSASSVSAAKESPILLNYKDTGMGASQVIVESTTLVPLKSLATAMGYTLSWNQTTKIANLIRPDREVVFTVGSTMVKVNGVSLALSKTPRIINGAVYVPLISAVNAFGGKIGYNNSNGQLDIVDIPRFVAASAKGRFYWVSQKNGEVYFLASVTGKPEKIGGLPLKESPYTQQLELEEAGNGTDLLLLKDEHYSMFTDFSNGYQALIQNKKIKKQMDYHYITSSYIHAPQLKTTQLFMTDARNIQYINQDGSLGKPYELEKITGQSGEFKVEYAANDVALVRSVDTTQLFAINTQRSESINLSLKLISTEDQKEWNHADATDRYVLSRMLVLKKREGDILTFSYTPLLTDQAKTVTYTLASK